MNRTAKRSSTALQTTRRDAPDALIDEAIANVSLMYHRGVVATVVAIGDYLLDTFFAGNVDLVASNNPTKSVAMLRFLERADETPLSAHALRRSIPLSIQYHALPKTTAD